MKNSWMVVVCLRLLFVRKLEFCIVTLREIPLVLVLKNLRLVKGSLTVLKIEKGFTVWLCMEKLPVQIKMLLKNLWRSLNTLWIERDLFLHKYSIVTRQASSGKKMPKRTYITIEEKALPGHKPMKDRLTLLLCGNASGDFEVKLLLVYHSENPRVFKKNNVQINKLSIKWRSHHKAWVTRQLFTKWFNEVFVPSVKEDLEEKNLPLKALLVMDNAPAHPQGLEEDLGAEYGFIQVKFLPPNTTPLIQPIDQQVISNFKKLYTKALFQSCFEIASEAELNLTDFWKDHFNILHCLRIIDKAWSQDSHRKKRSASKKTLASLRGL